MYVLGDFSLFRVLPLFSGCLKTSGLPSHCLEFLCVCQLLCGAPLWTMIKEFEGFSNL